MFRISRGVWVLIWAAFGTAVGIASFNITLSAAATLAFSVTVVALWRAIVLNGVISGNTALLALMALFHFGVVVPVVVFGAPEPSVWWASWLDSPNLPYVVALCALGIIATQAGYELGAGAGEAKSRIRGVLKYPPTGRALFQLWTVVAFSWVVFHAALGIHQGFLFSVREVYLQASHAGDAKWFGLSGDMAILSGFVAVAFAPRKHAWLPSLLIVMSLLPLFLLGERGQMIVNSAALGIILYMKGVRIPRVAIVAGVCLTVALIPIMRHVRGGVAAFSNVPLLDPLYEMGMQIRTVVYTQLAIHDHFTHLWLGASYWNACLRILPNIDGVRALGGTLEQSPAYWLTYTFSQSGGGWGSSIFAEAYLNFGLFGIAFIPSIVGYFMANFRRLAFISPTGLAVYGVFMKAAFWMVREDSYTIMRPLAWLILLLVVSLVISRAMQRNGLSNSHEFKMAR